MYVRTCAGVMRLLVLAVAIITPAAIGAKAADLAYPPQYGAVAPPQVVPPQVMIVPGPTALPQYNGAPVPPLVVGPYGVPPPTAGVALVPRRPCGLTWRCGACDWQPGCTAYPEHYPAPYESLAPRVYPDPQSQSAAGPYSGEPYSGGYAPAPQVYSGPIRPYAPDPYRP
jgi:hypothetical protein